MERKKHTRYILQLLEHHQNLCKICNYNYFLFLRTLKDSTKLKMKFWLKDCDIQKYHYSMSSDVNKCYQAPKANRIVYWQNVKSSANNITPDQEWLKVIIQVPGYKHVLTGSRSHVPLLHMIVVSKHWRQHFRLVNWVSTSCGVGYHFIGIRTCDTWI